MIARIRNVIQGHSGRVTVGTAAGLAVAVVAAVVALLVVVAGPSSTTSATDVVPKVIPGNPTCADLGLTDGGPINYKDGDWTSAVLIDAVIVKGGPKANVYNYVPPKTSDTGLEPPLNTKNGKLYGLSHVLACGADEPPPTPDTPTPVPTKCRIDCPTP